MQTGLHMTALNDRQIALLDSLGLPCVFEGLDDEELMRIEDTLSDAMMLHGINEAGNGLNEYGELCRSIIVALPD